jgi:hypothetical protein
MKKRRTEDVGVQFLSGYAEGWAFGVSDAFRLNLDIRLDQRIDSERSKTKARALGRKLQPSEKVTRSVWTEGSPPSYSFARGHMFHQPPSAHTLPWDEALKVLRRTVTVIDSRPDAGALIEVFPQDEETEGTSIAESDEPSDSTGWVEVEIHYYEGGKWARKEKTVFYQSAFVKFLRTGKELIAEAPAVVRQVDPSLSVVDALVRASLNRSLVHVVYNSGSSPGVERPLIALGATSEHLTARDPGVRTTKTYAVAKISSVVLQDGTTALNPGVLPVMAVAERLTPVLSTLDEYVQYLKPKFVADGWNVFEEKDMLGVGRFTKNGKGRKNPSFRIEFVDRTVRELFDVHTGEIFSEHRELTGREKPWRVESKRQPQARAFAELHKAIEFFAAEVFGADSHE